jgi:iron(III) transport system ATP-binding protein
MTLHYFATLNNGQEVEIVVPSDLSDILPDGQKVSLNVVPEKINVFDRETKNTLIPEGA